MEEDGVTESEIEYVSRSISISRSNSNRYSSDYPSKSSLSSLLDKAVTRREGGQRMGGVA